MEKKFEYKKWVLETKYGSPLNEQQTYPPPICYTCNHPTSSMPGQQQGEAIFFSNWNAYTGSNGMCYTSASGNWENGYLDPSTISPWTGMSYNSCTGSNTIPNNPANTGATGSVWYCIPCPAGPATQCVENPTSFPAGQLPHSTLADCQLTCTGSGTGSFNTGTVNVSDPGTGTGTASGPSFINPCDEYNLLSRPEQETLCEQCTDPMFSTKEPMCACCPGARRSDRIRRPRQESKRRKITKSQLRNIIREAIKELNEKENWSFEQCMKDCAASADYSGIDPNDANSVGMVFKQIFMMCSDRCAKEFGDDDFDPNVDIHSPMNPPE